MKSLLSIAMFCLASVGFSHPSGTYIIDGDPGVTVTFEVIGQCSQEVAGALPGKLRQLSFSEKASASPYGFVSTTYVEVHTDREVYVETDDKCLPIANGQNISASRSTFNGYSLRRVR